MNDNIFKNSDDIKNLNKIIKESNEILEGNCLYKNKSNFEDFEEGHRYNNKLILRNNLFKLAKISKNIIEIGLNGGHSAALYFYANPSVKLLSFDICYHKYVEPVANYLNNKYNLEFIKGDSIIKVPEYKNNITYDMIHIDGGHGDICALNDLLNCKKFANKSTFLVFDDSNAPSIKKILDEKVNENFIKEIDYEKLGLDVCYFHRIFNYY